MFSSFVEFYRENSKPDFCAGSRLEFSMPLTVRNLSLLSGLVSDSIIRIGAILIDGRDKELVDLEAGLGSAEVELSVPTGGQVNIFKDIDDLLKRNKQFLAGNPDFEFYVAKDDYYSSEGVDNPVYQKLRSISKLIAGLNDLAHYHDNKGKNKHLVFVSKNDTAVLKPIVLRPSIELGLLKGDDLDISLIEDLLDESGRVKHLSRERGVFRSSIIEFFQESQASEVGKFEYLICNWPQFLVLFSQNFDTYLSGYAFQKVKHEIAGIEIKLAEQFSKVTNDITGKLLGAPLSFVAIIALVKIKSGFEQLLVFWGIFIAAWILSSIIKNQYEQFLRVKNARTILFSSHESLKVDYPKELQEALESAVCSLDRSESQLSSLIVKFKALCWFPVIISVGVLAHRYWPVCN